MIYIIFAIGCSLLSLSVFVDTVDDVDVYLLRNGVDYEHSHGCSDGWVAGVVYVDDV